MRQGLWPGGRDKLRDRPASGHVSAGIDQALAPVSGIRACRPPGHPSSAELRLYSRVFGVALTLVIFQAKLDLKETVLSCGDNLAFSVFMCVCMCVYLCMYV